MEYLLFLQNLRDAAPHWLNSVILFTSEFVGGACGMILMALIYWCINKYVGTLLLMNFSFAYAANTVIKNIFRIDRPFLRDTRLTPYKPATGYSFPSGHTMLATGLYGGLAVCSRKKKWAVALFVFLTLLTGFGRNWLGAHTPQDVLVGIACSCAVIALNIWLLRWVDQKKNNDLLLFALSMVFFVALCLLYPADMKVAGIYGGAMVGWFVERRFVGFEVKGSIPFRAGMFLGGTVIVGVLYKVILPRLFAGLGKGPADMLCYFLTFLFIMAVWPWVIKAAGKKQKAKASNE